MDRSRNSLRGPLQILVHTPFTVLQKNPPVSLYMLVYRISIPYFWKRIMNSDKPVLTTHAAVLYGGVDSIMRANSKKINEQLSDAQTQQLFLEGSWIPRLSAFDWRRRLCEKC
jgi:hypothetical protein